MKKQTRLLLMLSLLPMFFTGCGTISGLQSSSGGSPSRFKYDKVAVLDFENSVSGRSGSGNPMGCLFADKIADELERRNMFSKVVRGPVDGDALVISGRITRCDDGNSSLRFWIGMGAGSSYFDADVNFKNSSGTELGTMKVDKNSWVLGGGIAAGQTVQTFMSDAAKKIADELAKTK